MDLQNTLTIAIEIARAAGGVLRQEPEGELAIERKSSQLDLVTAYDRAAEGLIIGQLQAAFPAHAILTEESGQLEGGNGRYTWHIDPLDGTTNFAHGFPVYCVSLALYEGQQPLVGVVYDPTRDECFSAAAGEGAWLASAGQTVAIRVSRETELDSSLLATGYPYDVHSSSVDNIKETAAFIKRARGLRRAGAAALDMAYVAAGRLDGYWEYKLNSWDIAAGVLLVLEAGGAVTLIDGRPFELTPKLNLIASNGRIHEQMAAVLKELV
jgi:myo-inositol-1(or 4)-monophosphatase